MTTTNHYDVIIIGSGAGGSTLAYSLAETGGRILLIERGNWVPREKENWDTREVFINDRSHATDMWYDHGGKPSGCSVRTQTTTSVAIRKCTAPSCSASANARVHGQPRLGLVGHYWRPAYAM